MNARDKRAGWAAEYRQARKVRRFMEALPDLPPTLSLTDGLSCVAFGAAGRVDGKRSDGGCALWYGMPTRLLWFRAGCRMPVAGPYAGALPA